MERLTPLPWQQELWSQLVSWRERLPHALLLHGGRGLGKRHLMNAYCAVAAVRVASERCAMRPLRRVPADRRGQPSRSAMSDAGSTDA